MMWYTMHMSQTILGKTARFTYTREAKPEAGNFARHLHNDYELLYFVEGDADYIVGSSTYRLHPHDLLLIPPATYHHLSLRSAVPYERFVINFSAALIPPEMSECTGGFQIFYAISPTRDAPVRQMLYALREVCDTFSAQDASLALIRTVQLLLLHLKYAAQGQTEPPRQNEPLCAILAYIDGHLSAPMDARDIATRFFVSPSWLAHTFSAFFGMGISQYISRKRILYAQQLLKTGVPPTRAAELCGYANYTTFYRQYRRFLAVSPADDCM